VGLINAICAFQGRFISRHDLAYTAIKIERELLDEAVGCQDQVFAAFGGFNVIEFNRPDDIVVNRVVMSVDRRAEFDESLLLYFTGITRSAQNIEREKIAAAGKSRNHLINMLKLVERGHALLTSRRPLSAFGELLDQAWEEKRNLGPQVTNPQIDLMYEKAREAGAIGGKLLGAGGGGFLLLFVPQERQESFRNAFNYPEVPFHINSAGSYIIHS
jgi:D-glycero-alpha-D-manno-heptose-7-phosphate kinase